MYRIRGADGCEEGPYSADTLKAWVAAGRISRQTAARSLDSTEWKPLGEFSDFRDPSTPPPIAPVPPRHQGMPPLPPPRPPAPRARWSTLALASLVLGCLGVFVLPAIAGWCCGFLALRRIRASKGALRGKGLAIGGILVSTLMLILVGSFLVMVINSTEFRRPGRPPMFQSTASGCESNLRELVLTVKRYANDHGDILPMGTNWCEAVRDYTPSLAIFTCPGSDPQQRASFAFNRNLAGRNQEEIHPDTVLLFESPGGWNATGTAEMAGSSGSPIWVGLVSGRVIRTDRRRLDGLRWNP